MKFAIIRNSLFVIIIFVFSNASISAQLQSQPVMKTIHITTPLSDALSYRFEKYLVYAYTKLGYKVIFEKILTARAREMVDAGQLDAIMAAEKEIENTYNNLLRVPVMLAKGALVLYCNAKLQH